MQGLLKTVSRTIPSLASSRKFKFGIAENHETANDQLQLAAMGATNGQDAAALRYDRTSLTAEGVEVMVEEDSTCNSETAHDSAENVQYLALSGDGPLAADGA